MTRFSWTPYLFFALLAFVSVTFLLDENQAINHHKFHENQDIQFSLSSTSDLVTEKIADLVRTLQLFSNSEKQQLRQLFRHPDKSELLAILAQDLNSTFPHSRFLTLLGPDKQIMASTRSNPFSAAELREVQYFGEHNQAVNLSIYKDNDNEYYFNIFSRADIGASKPAILVTSFSTALLSNILKTKQLHGHYLSIVQKLDHEVIVVDANGTQTKSINSGVNSNSARPNNETPGPRLDNTNWQLTHQLLDDNENHINLPTKTKIISVLSILGVISLLVFYQLQRSNRETKTQNQRLLEKTERLLQLEQNLTVEKNRLSSLLSRMTTAYLALDEKWTITDLNPMAEDFFYTNKSELLGHSLWEKLPETASYFYKSLHSAMNYREHVCFNGYYPPHEKWFEVNVYPTPEGIALLIEDITNKKEYLSSVQEKALLVKAILDSSTEGIFTVNHNGIIKSFNGAAQSMFGYSEQEVIGQSISLLMPDAVAVKHDDLIKRFFRKGHSSVIGKMNEFEGKRRDGSTFPLELSVGLTGNAENTLFTGIAHDISKRKEAELQAQEALKLKYMADTANVAKSSFLSNMSHEIRTPLTSIIGFSESLLQSNQSLEERQKAIKSIISGGNHLLQLINGILDLSKIESGNLELEHREFSLFELLDETRSIIAAQIEKKGLEFHINYHFPLPTTILGDYLRLKQILINLCGNAAKFTEQGHILLNVRGDEKEKALYIDVVDTGIGMEQSALSKIFESFTQADSSTTRNFGGTGLGLSLSKHLANLMDGDIHVESELGKGSKFSLELPLCAESSKNFIYSHNDIPKVSEPSTEIDNKKKFSGTALIVEDNPGIQDLLAMLLCKLGLSTTIAENGETAIQSALNGDFDLVFMDMQMPVLGGIEATKRLREKGYDTPIVALTANAQQKDRDECLAAGCNDYLVKPINFDLLYKTCESYLEHETNNVASPLVSELLANEPEFEALVQKFVIQQLPTQLDAIKTHISNKDWHHIRPIAHQIKGSAGGFGYTIITERAAQLEFQLISENYSEVEILFDELELLMLRAISGLSTTSQHDNRSKLLLDRKKVV